MTKIELKSINKSFLGKKALEDISFTVESGDFVSILGPATAGKSTLLRIIAGTLKPEKGKVYFDDKDVTDYPAQKRNVGVIFQTFALYPNMSVYGNIASPLRAKGLPGSEVDKRVKEISSILRIEDLMEKSPYELSGGQAQRVATARALVKDAAAYLLDEPLTNIDYKLRESMKIELKRILEIKKSTIIYATPSPEETSVLTNRMIFLHGGKVVQTGPVKECFDAPANVTAGLHYSSPPMNIMDARVVRKDGKSALNIEGRLELDTTHLDFLLEEDEYKVGIYPYSLFLSPERKGMLSIPMKMELQELAGSEMTVRLRWNETSLTMYVPYERFLEEKVTVFLDPSDFYIFSKKTEGLVTRYRPGRKG